jgi:hypothetical protein
LFGESNPSQLPKELKDIKARQQKLAQALKQVQEIDAKQAAQGRGSEKGPAVPTTDPDAMILKNKTDGFAPNYLVVFATEGQSGLIMDYQVPGDGDEPATVMPAIENLKAAYGPVEPMPVEPPDPTRVIDLLADTNFNTGPNLSRLLDTGVTPWMPARSTGAIPDAPVSPQSDTSIATPSLPINPQNKRIDRSAFSYDPAANAYTCPVGRSLPLLYIKTDQTPAGPVEYSLYQCLDCSGCALLSKCLSGKKIKNRMLRRDQHEPLREQMAARLNTDLGRNKYKRRSHQAETPFAVLNTTMNVRQLLLRGLEKVRTEIGWIATAYNLKKMSTALGSRKKLALAI